MKHLVLTRIPPGDKWKDPKDKEVMETLTDAINHIFLRTGDKAIKNNLQMNNSSELEVFIKLRNLKDKF